MTQSKLYAEGKTGDTFLDALASAAPAPGGGGAAAYAGALGCALASMVTRLTIGKKAYQDVEEDMQDLLQRAETLRSRFYALIEEDAENFLPLAAAYRLPSETESEQAEKRIVMEAALQKACEAPLAMLQCACEALQIQKELARKGSALAISDAGAGAALLYGAMQAAAVNIYINVRSMQEQGEANRLLQETGSIQREGKALAEEIYALVQNQLLQEQQTRILEGQKK